MSRFESTLWTMIHGAGAGNDALLEEFIVRYRAPVVGFISRRGLASQAEDLAQEVFLRIFKDRVLGKADPAQGKFRSLLLAVTRHVIGHHLERRGAQKRGAGKVGPIGDLQIAAPAEETEEFDREWVLHLMEVALARLATDHPNYQAALRLGLFQERTHPEIAEELGRTAHQVKNDIHRGKAKLIQYVRDEIRDYSTGEEDFLDELKQVSRYLPSRPD